MRPNVLKTLTLLTSLVGITQPLIAFEAHEWGTFTSLLGSNGKTQNGMYHEDERLPAFVHGFGVTASDLTAPPPLALQQSQEALPWKRLL